MATSLKTTIDHGEEIGEKEDGKLMKDEEETKNYIEKHYARNHTNIGMFTPTPDYLCDFKFEAGFDIPAKMRAFHKNGYSQKEEDDKLHQIRRSMAFGDLDKISTIIDDIGMKNLPDLHEID